MYAQTSDPMLSLDSANPAPAFHFSNPPSSDRIQPLPLLPTKTVRKGLGEGGREGGRECRPDDSGKRSSKTGGQPLSGSHASDLSYCPPYCEFLVWGSAWVLSAFPRSTLGGVWQKITGRPKPISHEIFPRNPLLGRGHVGNVYGTCIPWSC